MMFISQTNGMLTYAVSAKTSEGVNLAFQKIAAELLGIRFDKFLKDCPENYIYNLMDHFTFVSRPFHFRSGHHFQF